MTMKSKAQTALELDIFNIKLTLNAKIEELEVLLAQRNEQIKELRNKVDRYEKEILYKSTDIETIKKILSLFASGNTYKTIKEKLKYNMMEDDIEFIKNICQNVHDLSPDMLLYYKEQAKAYEDSIKINPDILKDNMIQRLDILINDATMDLDKLEDLGEKNKLRVAIKDMIKEQNGVLKNIVEDKNGKEGNKKQDIDNVMDAYKTKIISFKALRQEAE